MIIYGIYVENKYNGAPDMSKSGRVVTQGGYINYIQKTGRIFSIHMYNNKELYRIYELTHMLEVIASVTKLRSI